LTRESCPLGYDCPQPARCIQFGIEIKPEQMSLAEAAGLETDVSVDGTIPQIWVCEGPVRHDTSTPLAENAATFDAGTFAPLKLTILDGMEAVLLLRRSSKNDTTAEEKEEK
jgi:hypothetical protein